MVPAECIVQNCWHFYIYIYVYIYICIYLCMYLHIYIYLYTFPAFPTMTVYIFTYTPIGRRVVGTIRKRPFCLRKVRVCVCVCVCVCGVGGVVGWVEEREREVQVCVS